MTTENIGSRLVDVLQITPGGDWWFFDPAIDPGKTRENLIPVMAFALVESKVDEDDPPYKNIVPLGADDVDIGGLIGIEMSYFFGRKLVHKSELGKLKFDDERGFADD